ncbi:hypothetical protein [Ruegeria arenilitoris]|uniref:hypothetical protein n=1 Tax=Ruegeria arenilitoris TaxID=1173585 RepID=UPI00147D73A8|nr:hypothetical protein [Ruegeria arenilitoris]
MGFDLANVDEMTGPIFTGAGSSMSTVWFLLAVLVCIYTLWSGYKHEHDAYKKLKK